MARSRGGLFGLAVAAGSLAASLLFIVWGAQQPLAAATLLALLVGVAGFGFAAALAVAAVGCYRLRYRLTDHDLRVAWAGPTEIVAFDDIEGLYAGQQVGALRQVGGLSWPGYHVGAARSRIHGTLRLFSTTLRTEALAIVVAGTRTLVLSPANPPAFRRALIERIEANDGGRRGAGPRPGTGRGLPSPVLVGLLAAALALLLVCVTAILSGYSGLPDTIVLQIQPPGRGAGPTPRAAVFALPLLGSAILGLNLTLIGVLRGREPALALLLCGSACLSELVIMLAALRVFS